MEKQLVQLATKAPGGTSANIAGIRTGWNAVVVAAVVWVVQRVAGVELDTSDPVIVVVVPAVVAVGYRLSRLVSDRWPAFGWVAFGIGKAPSYD